MKSRISCFNKFFNKTIFWKNVTLYWPIWGIYAFVCMVQQPFMIWLSNNMDYFYTNYDGYPDSRQLRDLIDCLAFEPYIAYIAFAALFAGMALYSYLYNNKSANMIHALPVDRTQLYGTAVISGLAFMVVPLLATAVITTCLCVIYTIPGIGYVWLWFLMMAATAVVAFSIVTICALFTGHIVVLPIYVAAVNILPWVVYYLVYLMITTFGYGVQTIGSTAQEIATLFCPVQCFMEALEWNYQYEEITGNFVGAQLAGWQVVGLYMVSALVFYGAAYVIYRKRRIEQAGDFLTVNWVKPIFRCAIGIVGGTFGAMIIRTVLLETTIGCGLPMYILLMLVAGAVCYFAADMFIKKSFHVFKKKNWAGCGIFMVVFLVFFGVFYQIAKQQEGYVPQKDNIKEATVNLGYEVTFTGEDTAIITQLHQQILDQIDVIQQYEEMGNRTYEYVYIGYQLSNGEVIRRNYKIPYEVEGMQQILEQIAELEKSPENFLNNLFYYGYENVDTVTSGYFEAPMILKGEVRDELPEGEMPDVEYQSFALDAETGRMLFDAIVADAKAGTLLKYNYYGGNYNSKDEELYSKSTEAYINLEYLCTQTSYSKDSYYAESGEAVQEVVDDISARACVCFGPDCENIVEVLIYWDLIETVEDIWWGGAEDLLK